MTPATASTPPDPIAPDNAGVNAPADLRAFVFALFFTFGGITSLNDIIIPKLKALFTLSNAEAMLVQSAFFGAYLIVSIPAAVLVRRVGYMRTAVVGLLAMTAGCLLFVPASASAQFSMFLLALFVLAAGITTVQVVANPLISLLGPPRTAESRLTFGQAFNSLGTTLFPFVGSILILGSLPKADPAKLSGAALGAFRAAESSVVARAYLGLAAALAVVAVVVWSRRKRLRETPAEHVNPLAAFTLLKRPRFAFGMLCVFLYVGAEVAIGSMMVAFLVQPDVLAATPRAAGEHIPFYWGGAMVGRFLGAWLLRVVSPGKVLAGAAAAALVLLLAASQAGGWPAGWALLAVGLFNSIMFPTVFALSCQGLGVRTAEGSGLLCVAIVGGAVVPWLTGRLADLTTLRGALIVPALCYLVILAFGLYARRSPQGAAGGAPAASS